VTNRFGARLYEIFFKAYSEKLWGISCKDLDADFAAQRIKKLSLLEAIKGALFGGGGKKHKTLVDRFAYPRLGTGSFYRKMAEKIEAKGGRILLRTPVRKVRILEGGGGEITLTDGTVKTYDHVVSSMPLTDLVLGLEPPEEIVAHVRKLTYRNTILAYLEIEKSDLFPDQWIYVHSPDLDTGRITNFRNWLPSLYGDNPNTILCMEYWCYDADQAWRESDEWLIARAKDEMARTGLLGGARILGGKIIRIGKSYPVYGRNYRQHLEPVERYLSTVPSLTPIGRYGAFKYNNQDHSILMGVLAARNILGKAHHDLWQVNTDYDYQESAKIGETGLEKS
jgi:protoporphyrinogen oxidase